MATGQVRSARARERRTTAAMARRSLARSARPASARTRRSPPSERTRRVRARTTASRLRSTRRPRRRCCPGMGELGGFLKIHRVDPNKRPKQARVEDFQEFVLLLPQAELQEQGARCMDCGIPFCHSGCPLGNLIPDWNDLVYRDRWRDAIDALHATNNFPEFTGRICPAPCEAACVLDINDDAVTIKQIEVAIIDRAFEERWVKPRPPALRSGRSVAVIGSGPAGLAAAAELNQFGHQVTVFERSDRVGGLLRYGVPDFKLDKRVVERRVDILEAEGIEFRTSTEVGKDIDARELRDQFDAIVIATGSTAPRDRPVPGRKLGGVHFAMEYLEQRNRSGVRDATRPAPGL